MAQNDTDGAWVTAEAILAAQDLPEVDVPTPEWGGSVRVRALTMGEVLEIRKATGLDERQVVIQTLALGFVHPALTVQQAEALLSKSGMVAQRVLQAINSLNGQGPGQGVREAQAGFPPGPGTPPVADPGAGAGADAG